MITIVAQHCRDALSGHVTTLRRLTGSENPTRVKLRWDEARGTEGKSKGEGTGLRDVDQDLGPRLRF